MMSLDRLGRNSARRFCFWAPLLIGLSWPSVALPQASVAPVIYPDELNVGQVRVGATAEASVRVIVPGPDIKGVKVSMQPPPFLRIEQTRSRTIVFGSPARGQTSCIVCDLSVSFDTSQAGEFNGELTVQIADEQLRVPVSISVLEQEPGLTRVLVLDSPFQGWYASWASRSTLERWLELVKSVKLDVHYFLANFDRGRPMTREVHLSNFDVIIAHFGVTAAASDFERLKEFAESGGRVIVCANRTFHDSVTKANEFVAALGLNVADLQPRGQVRLIEIGEEHIAEGPLTAGVRRLQFDNPSPITVTDEEHAEIVIGARVFDRAGFVARARAGKGDVIVVGVTQWWRWIAVDPKESDDVLLLKNLLTRGRAQVGAR